MAYLNLSDLILFQDQDFLVINKPPFIATLEDRASDVNILKLVRKEFPEATVGHRLDKETSGVLIVAKHPEAYKHISLQFENREVTKIYHAVIDGRHDYQQRKVLAPIEKLSDGTVKISRSGKPSETTFQTLQFFKKHTLVEANPTTGRMHQIRIHLAHIKSPISGDHIYGGQPIFLSEVISGYKTAKNQQEEPFLKRFGLHALKITFKNLTGELNTVEASYPKDFKALLNQLNKAR